MADELDPKEEEVALGLLAFTVNGVERTVPELKWRSNRTWQKRLSETFAELASVPSDTPDGLASMLDAERDLVLAYDTTHALGDLEDATEREIDAIYNRLVTVAFPLASSPTAAMVMIIRAVASSARPNSMNGPSPIGTSGVPRILRPASRSDRSASTTRRRRSA